MTQKIILTDDIDTRKIYQLVNEGVQLACPRCSADLDVALTPEVAREKGLRTGIFCPKNENHFALVLEFDRRDFWEKVKERLAKQEAEKH